MSIAPTLQQKIRFIEGLLGKSSLSRTKSDISVWCPYCNKPNKDKRKFVIRVSDNICHCWVCGFSSRTLVPVIKKFGTKSEMDTYREFFLPFVGVKLSEDTIKTDNNDNELKLPINSQLLANVTSKDPDVRHIKKYIESRGLTKVDMLRFRFCVSPDLHRRVIFPSFDQEGNLNYFVTRSIDNKVKPKYINAPIERESIIFNEIDINWKKRLVLCEGPFDYVKCGDNATPMLGSDISEDSLLFNKIVANETPVTLILDADMQDKVSRISKKFQLYDIDVNIVSLGNSHDPGELSKEQVAEILLSAHNVNWKDDFAKRLKKAMIINRRI